MRVNSELTKVVGGRIIRRFQESGGQLLIFFHDGSVLKIQEMQTNSPPLGVGAQIKAVEEDGTVLKILCQDGTGFSLRLTDPGAGVFVLAEDNRVEYSG